MTESPSPAAERLFTALAELRQSTAAVSYAMLVRQAAAQQLPRKISSQRLSDWFGGKAVPADPAVVRFLIEYLQRRVTRTSDYKQRPLSWWLDLHREALRQRQASADERRRTADLPPSPYRLGRPINQCDPLALEVHPAIRVPGAGAAADVPPGYVPRAHDNRLREVADQMLGGGVSRLVTLVGGSSTGKTRAGWELARYLEQQRPGRWRLWHPFDPTRPQAVLADLAKAGPNTIVWLNEAQHFLMPANPVLGERIAAGLRTLLTDPSCGPVLILATLWPDYWTTLTTRPTPESPDVYGQARDLLALGTQVSLGDTFTAAELAGLSLPCRAVDARLRYAAEHAEDGRITQYLAGAPALEDRYRAARPAARAILQVAIDARRLGHPPALPHALLEQAAPGYLDDHDWDALGEDWLELALAYTAQSCRGARGPLTRIRTRRGQPSYPAGQTCYRLADYLEQLGRTERARLYPPDSLWGALSITRAEPDLLRNLGAQAERRGRYQHAIWLYRRAADRGDTGAVWALVRLREHAGDREGAEALAAQAADRGAANVLQMLIRLREIAGHVAGAEASAAQAADRRRARIFNWMGARRREMAGDPVGAEAAYRRSIDNGDPDALRSLARLQGIAGDPTGTENLALLAADRGTSTVLLNVAAVHLTTGDPAGAEALYRQAADRGNTDALLALARLREEADDPAGAEGLYRRAADCGNTDALLALARLRETVGDSTGADRIRAFGLTGSGDIETGLDFDASYVVLG